MPAHLRVSLTDRPGALAVLARALAEAGANVQSVTVLERDQGRAVDDLLLEWPYERPFDAVVRAVEGCGGTRLHGLRHVAEPAMTGEADVLRQVLEQPGRAMETVVDALPQVLLADWAGLLDRRWRREPVYGTTGSPLPLPETPGPLGRPRAMAVHEHCLVVVPVPGTTLRVVVGRFEGPAFSRGEVERTAALVAVTAHTVRLACRPGAAAAATTDVTGRVLHADPTEEDCA